MTKMLEPGEFSTLEVSVNPRGHGVVKLNGVDVSMVVGGMEFRSFPNMITEARLYMVPELLLKAEANVKVVLMDRAEETNEALQLLDEAVLWIRSACKRDPALLPPAWIDRIKAAGND